MADDDKRTVDLRDERNYTFADVSVEGAVLPTKTAETVRELDESVEQIKIRQDLVDTSYIGGLTLDWLASNQLLIKEGAFHGDGNFYLIEQDLVVTVPQPLLVNSWYYVFCAFAIVDGRTRVEPFVSTDFEGRNVPKGYTGLRRIGSFRTDAAGGIFAFVQTGEGNRRNYSLYIGDIVANGFNNAYGTLYTGLVPQGAIEGHFNVTLDTGGAPANPTFYMVPELSQVSIFPAAISAAEAQSGVNAARYITSNFSMVLPTTAAYCAVSILGLATDDLRVKGWTDEL